MPATRATKARDGATAASAAETALPGVTSAGLAAQVARGAADVPAVSEALAGPDPAAPDPAATVDRVPEARVVPAVRAVAETAVPVPVAGRVSPGIPARDPAAMVATVDVVVLTSVRNR